MDLYNGLWTYITAYRYTLKLISPIFSCISSSEIIQRNLYHEAKPSCISCIYHEAKPSCICEVYHVAELYNLIIPRRKIMAEKMISEQNKSSFYIGNRQKFM